MKTNPVYLTRQWKIVRKAVLARDAYSCKIRLPGCKGRARSVDHVQELEDGGAPYDMGNLVAACVSCNTAKGNKARHRRAHNLNAGSRREW